MTDEQMDEFITDLNEFDNGIFELINQANIRYRIKSSKKTTEIKDKEYEKQCMSSSVYDEWREDDYQSRYNDWKSDQRSW